MKKVLQVLCLLMVLITSVSLAQQDTETKQPSVVQLNPPTAGDYKAPLFYSTLWKEVMKCTGLYIPLSRTKDVRWSYVYADAFYLYEDREHLYIGYTFVLDNRIVLIVNGVEDHRLIKHEMAHYLMWQKGLRADHPDNIFKKCKLLNNS